MENCFGKRKIHIQNTNKRFKIYKFLFIDEITQKIHTKNIVIFTLLLFFVYTFIIVDVNANIRTFYTI